MDRTGDNGSGGGGIDSGISGDVNQNTGNNGGGSYTPTGNGGTDDFMTQLQGMLLKSSGMVSSENTNIDETLAAALKSISGANNSTKSGINATYDEQEQAAAKAGADKLTSTEDASRGFATNTALLQNISTQTDKTINDLEKNRQTALMSGDAAMADKIATLQFQALTMKNDNMEKIFTNLVSAAGVMTQAKSADTAAKSQSTQEQSAIAGIATKYGIPMYPGDTIASITARAAPFASEEERLQNANTVASINKSNAEANAAINGSKTGVTDPQTIGLIGDMALKNPSIVNSLDSKTSALVFADMEKKSQPRAFSADELSTGAQAAATAGTPYATAKAAIASNPLITNKSDAYSALDKAYASSAPTDNEAHFGPTTGPLAQFLKGTKLKPGERPGQVVK